MVETGKTISAEFRQDIERHYRVLTEDEENVIVNLAQNAEDIETKAKARNLLVNAQLRSLHSMAFGYADNRCHITDLFAEGVLGIDDALKLYDPTRGIRFFSYAQWHIKNRMTLFLHSDYNVVMPMNKAKKGHKNDVMSMHSPINEGTGTIEDTMYNDDDSRESFEAKKDLKKMIGKAKLPKRSLAFLNCHFVYDMTMDEIGEAFGVSKQAVSINLKKALDVIRKVNKL